MINKYNELHEKFLVEFVTYYNLKTKINSSIANYTLAEMIQVSKRMRILLKEMNDENRAVQKLVRIRYAARNLAAQETKNLKKENKNDNPNN